MATTYKQIMEEARRDVPELSAEVVQKQLGRAPETLVLDAVYRPIRTPLLLAARRRGCTAIPGGEWFVRQARAQFELFTHQEPDDALMRAAFESAVSAGGSGP